MGNAFNKFCEDVFNSKRRFGYFHMSQYDSYREISELFEGGTISGTYFLLDRDKCGRFIVLYIGRSKDIFRRIYQHKIKGEIKFNRVYYVIESDDSIISKNESNYIFKFSPKHNKCIPTNSFASNKIFLSEEESNILKSFNIQNNLVMKIKLVVMNNNLYISINNIFNALSDYMRNKLEVVK